MVLRRRSKREAGECLIYSTNLRWDSPQVVFWRAAVAGIITSTWECDGMGEDQGCGEPEGAEFGEKPISDFSTSWPRVDHPE